MSAPQFRFHMKYVSRPKDSYYVTRWDRASPLSVIAETREKAFEKATEMLGDAGDWDYWVAKILSIEEVAVTDTGGEE